MADVVRPAILSTAFFERPLVGAPAVAGVSPVEGDFSRIPIVSAKINKQLEFLPLHDDERAGSYLSTVPVMAVVALCSYSEVGRRFRTFLRGRHVEIVADALHLAARDSYHLAGGPRRDIAGILTP